MLDYISRLLWRLPMLRRKLPRAFSRSSGLLLIFSLLLLSPSLSFAQPPCPWPGLTGSFLQPALGDQWSATQWDQEYTYMGNACLSQLVLQWSADSKAHTTVYPTNLTAAGYTYSQN